MRKQQQLPKVQSPALFLIHYVIASSGGEDAVDKGFRVEGLEVLDALPDPDELDRDAQLLHHAHHRAASRGAVKLGQH